jgi:D-lactate dehydrogenase (cytochrome)
MNNYYQYTKKLISHALKLNGTCTGEHGIGLGKKKYLFDQFGAEPLDLMKSIKTTIDPNNILNPNKIF